MVRVASADISTISANGTDDYHASRSSPLRKCRVPAYVKQKTTQEEKLVSVDCVCPKILSKNNL